MERGNARVTRHLFVLEYKSSNTVSSLNQGQPDNLEDGGRRGAAKAAGRVERVHAEELVDEAAGDAEHGGAAVLALSVELEGLDLGVVVAHPRDARDVAGLAVRRVDAG